MTVDKNIQYIRSLLKEEQDTGRLRREEEKRHIPVIRPEVLRLLTLCIRLSKTEKILEIGAGEGYSAICFAKAIGENADIITIEQDEERVYAARSNIQTFGLEKAITVIHDDAAAACRSMPGEEIFDMVLACLKRTTVAFGRLHSPGEDRIIDRGDNGQELAWFP